MISNIFKGRSIFCTSIFYLGLVTVGVVLGVKLEQAVISGKEVKTPPTERSIDYIEFNDKLKARIVDVGDDKILSAQGIKYKMVVYSDYTLEGPYLYLKERPPLKIVDLPTYDDKGNLTRFDKDVGNVYVVSKQNLAIENEGKRALVCEKEKLEERLKKINWDLAK
jgi:hypothetical protein